MMMIDGWIMDDLNVGINMNKWFMLWKTRAIHDERWMVNHDGVDVDADHDSW